MNRSQHLTIGNLAGALFMMLDYALTESALMITRHLQPTKA